MQLCGKCWRSRPTCKPCLKLSQWPCPSFLTRCMKCNWDCCLNAGLICLMLLYSSSVVGITFRLLNKYDPNLNNLVLALRFRATKTMGLYCMLRDVLGFFTSTEWEWKTDNLVKLEKNLSPYDRKVQRPTTPINTTNIITQNSTTVGYVTLRCSYDTGLNKLKFQYLISYCNIVEIIWILERTH